MVPQAGRLAEKPNRLLLFLKGATGRAGLPGTTIVPGFHPVIVPPRTTKALQINWN